MRARSAIFDLYGDHLHRRGYRAPIAGTIRVLDALGVAAPAVRTAVSRMVREGWLEADDHDGARGYRATPRARRRLDSARDRIYGHGDEPWDGTWHVILLGPPQDRAARDHVHSSLTYLGYAQAAPRTWMSPRRSPELATTLDVDATAYTELESTHPGSDAALAHRLWHLDDLAERYRAFLAEGIQPLVHGPDLVGLRPAEVFARRAELVHAWRKFLFSDPGLPPELLGPDWPGHDAARAFRETADHLLPQARSFVWECLGDDTAPSPERSAS